MDPCYLDSEFENGILFMANDQFLITGELVHGSMPAEVTSSDQYQLPAENRSNYHHYHGLNDLPPGEALRYIDQMLMEEDAEEDEMTIHALQESSDFHDKERSFYEVLGQKYPPSPQLEFTTGDHPSSDDVPPLTESQLVSSDEAANEFLPSNGNVFPVLERPEAGNTTNDQVIATRCKKKDVDQYAEEFDTWTYTDGGCEVFAAYIADLRLSGVSQKQPAPKSGPHKRGTAKRKESVDLRSLLIICAESVAKDDHPAANELLRQIRPHSSPIGDSTQRLAHYFVRGLEARLAGTGSWMHKAFRHEKMTMADYVKVYCTSLISSSFRKITIFASNKLIAVRSKKSARVHIIDFGILYGFQWAPFIQHLAAREGGPPKLRITGIDFPQPRCETAESVDDTGFRLTNYAKMFDVPFEYNSIMQSWESIRVEDLKIEEGEFVVVNCLYRAENLPDEMTVVESSRSKVLDLIRKINPDIFVHAVVNAGYGVPYFVTRFREALFHYSALFDMAETIIPNERPERMLLESILGNEALNVVACEGSERVDRPETYKQWQLRYLRAGFKQVSFGRKLSGSIHNKVRNTYHKEFVTLEDQKWLVMSWKGKAICAISCWKPAAPV